ncbi:MAG: urease accessory protein UreF [Coleofasciculaceae cyanobacterium RL_1_1]|nr:urease accessory protein UreF [Coleofasciculaceae cyanobacterium RL_1_1]
MPSNLSSDFNPIALLSLLQLASAALPVGAYSYSEGLEFVIESGRIASAADLRSWLTRELTHGSVRIDGAVMLRVHRAVLTGDRAAIAHWNAWLAAMRETTELRRQSEQMGRALADLVRSLDPKVSPWLDAASRIDQVETRDAIETEIQFAIAFGIAAAQSGIDERSSAIGFLQSWVTNAIGAGVKLIPLGQTDGQRVLRALDGAIARAATFAIEAEDDDLETSGWGLSLASMQHETQRVRLFRS